MHNSSLHTLMLILVIAAVTFLTRVLPFLLFPDNRETPPYIVYLSRVLPGAIIGMLVIYCLRSTLTTLTVFPFGLPELIAGAAVILLHIWKRNTLLSIAAGTVLYMILIQTVFS